MEHVVAVSNMGETKLSIDKSNVLSMARAVITQEGITKNGPSDVVILRWDDDISL